MKDKEKRGEEKERRTDKECDTQRSKSDCIRVYLSLPYYRSVSDAGRLQERERKKENAITRQDFASYLSIIGHTTLHSPPCLPSP